MEGRPARPSTYGIHNEENLPLSQLTELIEISLGHAHTILHSVEDITRLPKAAASNLRNRDSGYSEYRWPVNGDDLGRKLVNLGHRVEETRTCLRDLHRANLRGLQLILEVPEDLVVTELQSKIKANFEAERELRRLAENSPGLQHINTFDLEDTLPPVVKIRSLSDRLLQVRNSWDLPFPTHNSTLSLCNSAKLLNSGTNKGVLEHAQIRDVDKQVIKTKGGSFQFWKCDLCDFRVRYHATQCKSSNIESTDEKRRPGKGYITLRTVFLAKSHLYKQPGQPLRYACLFCMGSGKKLEGGRTAFAREEDLADHIDRCHDAGSLPQLFMKKLYVASPDDMPTGRYDVQFHRMRSALAKSNLSST